MRSMRSVRREASCYISVFLMGKDGKPSGTGVLDGFFLLWRHELIRKEKWLFRLIWQDYLRNQQKCSNRRYCDNSSVHAGEKICMNFRLESTDRPSIRRTRYESDNGIQYFCPPVAP